MAAPSGAYRTKSIFTRNLANTADIQHLIAILHTDKATMCARFYLDGLLNSTLAEGDGVTGYCRIGSANYNMHNSARIGNLRLYDSGDCVVFNDGGLNTAGITDPLTLASARDIFSYIINSFLSKSAYYVDGEYGIQVSKDGGATWTEFNVNFQAQNTVVNSPSFELATYRSSPTVAFLQAAKTFHFRTFHRNAEKTTYSTTISDFVLAGSMGNPNFAPLTGNASQNNTGFSATYAGEAIFLDGGIRATGPLYTNNIGDTLAAPGYYIWNGYWYRFDGSKVTLSGLAQAGYWPQGDPANSTTQTFLSFQDTMLLACGFNNARTLYHRIGDLATFYNSADLTSFAPDGYYTVPPRPQNPTQRAWIRLINGVQVENGLCAPGDPDGV